MKTRVEISAPQAATHFPTGRGKSGASRIFEFHLRSGSRLGQHGTIRRPSNLCGPLDFPDEGSRSDDLNAMNYFNFGASFVSTLWHPAQKNAEDLEKESQFLATRRSGPGGQHRNKVETAVIVTHRETGVRAEASERRSQAANRQVAYQRLRLQLAVHIRRTPPSTPSELWRRRVRNGKVSVSKAHADFPSLIAELLDQWRAHEDQIAKAAQVLEITTSQAVKLLKLEPAALEQVNRGRQARGLRPLK